MSEKRRLRQTCSFVPNWDWVDSVYSGQSRNLAGPPAAAEMNPCRIAYESRSRAYYRVVNKNKYLFPNEKSACLVEIKWSIAPFTVAGNTLRDRCPKTVEKNRPPVSALVPRCVDVRDFWRPSRSAQGVGTAGIRPGTKRRAKDATAWGLLGVHTHNNVSYCC